MRPSVSRRVAWGEEEESFRLIHELQIRGVVNEMNNEVLFFLCAMSFPSIVSVEAVKPENEKESGVHRSPLAPDGPIKIPVKESGYAGYGIPAVDGCSYDTVVTCFEATAKNNGGSKFLGHREYKEDGTRGDYVWCTYKEAYDDVVAYGVGLTNLCSIKGVDGKSGDAGQPRVG